MKFLFERLRIMGFIKRNRNAFRSRIDMLDAKIRKSRTVSGILKRAEQGDEEENMGRS